MLTFSKHEAKRAQSPHHAAQHISLDLCLLWLAIQFVIVIAFAIIIIIIDYVASAADARHTAMWAHVGVVIAMQFGGAFLQMLILSKGTWSVAAGMWNTVYVHVRVTSRCRTLSIRSLIQ